MPYVQTPIDAGYLLLGGVGAQVMTCLPAGAGGQSAVVSQRWTPLQPSGSEQLVLASPWFSDAQQ